VRGEGKAAKPGADLKECANGCPIMIVIPRFPESIAQSRYRQLLDRKALGGASKINIDTWRV
jgi:hypothetical protein